MKQEKWKYIPGYEGLYMASTFGRILNARTMSFVCQYNKGKHSYYKKVELWKNKSMKRYKVHRLIALTFMPNPNNLPQINHIDENPQNNHVNNLEWCDAKHNVNHGMRNAKGSIAQGNAVGLYSIDGDLVGVYSNARQAADAIGMSYDKVRAICMGKQKADGDYLLRYLNKKK